MGGIKCIYPYVFILLKLNPKNSYQDLGTTQPLSESKVLSWNDFTIYHLFFN
jgi:hypothetical protein